MEYDEFGLPVPADFDEAPRRFKARVTGGRIAVVVVVLLLAGFLGIMAERAPNLLDQTIRAFDLADRRLIHHRQQQSIDHLLSQHLSTHLILFEFVKSRRQKAAKQTGMGAIEHGNLAPHQFWIVELATDSGH